MDLGFDSRQMFLECKFFANGTYHKLPCESIVEAILDANYGKCYGINLPDDMVQGTESKGLSLTINTFDSQNSKNETAIKRYEGLLLSVDGSMNPVAWEKTLVGGGVYLNLDVSLEHLQLMNVQNGDPSQPSAAPEGFKIRSKLIKNSYIVSTCHCLLNTEKRNIKVEYLKKYNFCTALDSTNCIVPNVTQDQDVVDAVASCRSRCHVQCDTWRYKMNPTTTPLNSRAYARLKPVPAGDILHLDLSYKSLEYKEFIQSYQITLDTFIGNLGGQITLWIGGSMITLLNVPIFLSNCIFARNSRKARRKMSVAAE
uniref:Uncharacterized protein n=1 Tax=Romanomermis culicivorax TaxID=13658 RepID=A0A915HXH3_ROMCU